MFLAIMLNCLVKEVSFPTGYYTLEQVAEKLGRAGEPIEVDPTASDLAFAISGEGIPTESILAALDAEPMLSRRVMPNNHARYARSAEWQKKAYASTDTLVRGIVGKISPHYATAKAEIDKAYLGDEESIANAFIRWQSNPRSDELAEMMRGFGSGNASYSEIALAPTVYDLLGRSYWQAPDWKPLSNFVNAFAPLSGPVNQRMRYSVSRAEGDMPSYLLPRIGEPTELVNAKYQALQKTNGAITWRLDPAAGLVHWKLNGKMPFQTTDGKPYRSASDVALIGRIIGLGIPFRSANVGKGYLLSDTFKFPAKYELRQLPKFGERQELLVSDFILMSAEASKEPIFYRVPTFCNRILLARINMPASQYWANAISPTHRWAGGNQLVEDRLGVVNSKLSEYRLACEPRGSQLKGLTHISDGCNEIECFSRASVLNVDLANDRLSGRTTPIAEVLDAVSKLKTGTNDHLRTWSAETYSIGDPGRIYPFARLYKASVDFKALVDRAISTNKSQRVNLSNLQNGVADFTKSLAYLGDSVPWDYRLGMATSVIRGHLENLPAKAFTVTVEPGAKPGGMTFNLIWGGEHCWKATIRGQ